MKTAIYTEDGTTQLVVTPETEFEKEAVALFREKPLAAKLFAGSFYDSRGGWIRQTALKAQTYGHDPDDFSLIVTIKEKDAMLSGIGFAVDSVADDLAFEATHAFAPLNDQHRAIWDAALAHARKQPQEEGK